MLLDPDTEAAFPGLVASGGFGTSPQNPDYNCIAWAIGEHNTDKWWQPYPQYAWSHWPPGILADGSLNSYIALFEQFAGYERCNSGGLESGQEKVAVYTSPSGEFKHVARQKLDGSWTSKLGDLEDVAHPTLEALEGAHYGRATIIFRRSLPAEAPG